MTPPDPPTPALETLRADHARRAALRAGAPTYDRARPMRLEEVSEGDLIVLQLDDAEVEVAELVDLPELGCTGHARVAAVLPMSVLEARIRDSAAPWRAVASPWGSWSAWPADHVLEVRRRRPPTPRHVDPSGPRPVGDATGTALALVAAVGELGALWARIPSSLVVDVADVVLDAHRDAHRDALADPRQPAARTFARDAATRFAHPYLEPVEAGIARAGQLAADLEAAIAWREADADRFLRMTGEHGRSTLALACRARDACHRLADALAVDDASLSAYTLALATARLLELNFDLPEAR